MSLKLKLRKIPLRRNPGNRFYVATIHYTLHPKSQDPNWLAAEKAAMPVPEWERDMEIKYNAMGGELVWPSFDYDKNVIKPFVLDERYYRVRLVDYGHRNPFCCLWLAIDFDGKAYVYREWYHPTYSQMQRDAASKVKRFTLTQHAKIVLTLSKQEQYINTLIDPQAAEVTFANSDDKKTVIHKLADVGLICTKAKKASSGLDTIESMFRDGKLFIFEDCINTIKEIQNYRWMDFTEKMQLQRNLKEAPTKKNDHACNCLKFFANYRTKVTPKPTMPHIPKMLAKNTLTDIEMMKQDIDNSRRKWRRSKQWSR